MGGGGDFLGTFSWVACIPVVFIIYGGGTVFEVELDGDVKDV